MKKILSMILLLILISGVYGQKKKEKKGIDGYVVDYNGGVIEGLFWFYEAVNPLNHGIRSSFIRQFEGGKKIRSFTAEDIDIFVSGTDTLYSLSFLSKMFGKEVSAQEFGKKIQLGKIELYMIALNIEVETSTFGNMTTVRNNRVEIPVVCKEERRECISFQRPKQAKKSFFEFISDNKDLTEEVMNMKPRPFYQRIEEIVVKYNEWDKIKPN